MSRVDCTCVIEGSKRAAGRADLERFLRAAAIEIAPVAADQAEIACEVSVASARAATLPV